MSPIIVRVFSSLSCGRDGLYNVQGHRIYLSDGDTHSPIGMVLDNYEPETTNLLKNLVKPGMVVIDVGAHVGYYTLLAARQTGNLGKVYSFEPAPSNYALLAKNIETTGYENIEARQAAVSSSAGSLDFHWVTQFSGTHSLHHRGFHAGGVITVDVVSIDGFLEEIGWPKIDVIKVDAEGSELDVLTGMRQLLDHQKNLEMIIEFFPSELRNAGKEPSALICFLDQSGFVVQHISDDDGLVPFKQDEMQETIEHLITYGDSINLYCKR